VRSSLSDAALAVYIGTAHDSNGNPRRGWVIYNKQGNVIGFVDEGYAGRGALVNAGLADVHATEMLRVTPGQYREMVRIA
jgi:hypothetical protein